MKTMNTLRQRGKNLTLNLLELTNTTYWRSFISKCYSKLQRCVCEWQGLRTSNLVYGWRTMTHIATGAMTSKVKGQVRNVM